MILLDDKTVVEQLIAFGAEISCKCETSGDTALHLAALIGHEELCKVLLNNGAYKDAVNLSGKTPYQTGVETGKIDVQRLQKIFEKSGYTQNQQQQRRKLTPTKMKQTFKSSSEDLDSEDEPLLG